MTKKALKSPDDLILGIREILSKNRCSFSVEELVLLEDCIKRLEETKLPTLDDQRKETLMLDVLATIFRLFAISKTLFDLFDN